MTDMSGTDIAWCEFLKLDPSDVCSRAVVSFSDAMKLYTVRSFGQDIFISPARREVYSDSPEGRLLIENKDYFFDLSVLWYLIGARNVPLSASLIKPSDVSGGQIFVKGTHVLPVDAIAEKFNNNKDLFLEVSTRFGGIKADHGDVSVKMLPFPRLPIYLILWFGDNDFPPRGQLLLDSSCSKHLSTDVLWAVTTVCCLLFLRFR